MKKALNLNDYLSGGARSPEDTRGRGREPFSARAWDSRPEQSGEPATEWGDERDLQMEHLFFEYAIGGFGFGDALGTDDWFSGWNRW